MELQELYKNKEIDKLTLAALVSHGVYTLEEFAHTPSEELRKIPNFGRTRYSRLSALCLVYNIEVYEDNVYEEINASLKRLLIEEKRRVRELEGVVASQEYDAQNFNHAKFLELFEEVERLKKRTLWQRIRNKDF